MEAQNDANQLQVIVQNSGLDATKSQAILEQFQDYFSIAADWENKAKAIVVTDASQIAEMQMARAGRLFLREKRIAIEKSRKQLKEQALREGKAIDGIANVLKALIVPIEQYLDAQENFVKLKEQAESAERERIAIENAEKERIAQEERERVERERIAKENEKLKREAIKKELQLKQEREKAEAARKAVEAKAKQEREKAEAIAKEKLEKERQRTIAAKKAAEEKAEKERIAAEKVAQAKLAAERKERERLEKELALAASQVECPFCHKTFIPKKKEQICHHSTK